MYDKKSPRNRQRTKSTQTSVSFDTCPEVRHAQRDVRRSAEIGQDKSKEGGKNKAQTPARAGTMNVGV